MQELKTSPSRDKRIERLKSETLWDVVVIGAGSTGAGIALDSASRGFKTLLLDASDFAHGASGNSSKFIATGPVCLKSPELIKALRTELIETKYLLANAPRLVKKIPLIIPCYKDFRQPFMYSVLAINCLLAYGGFRLGFPKWLRVEEVIRRLPDIKVKDLKGGVGFEGLKINDAGLIVALAKTAEKHGALALNYMQVKEIRRNEFGAIDTLICEDKVSGLSYDVHSRMVFNAAGMDADNIRRMAFPEARPLFKCVENTYAVIEKRKFEGESGMFVPSSSGAEKFCLPLGSLVGVGTYTQSVAEQQEPEQIEAQTDSRLIDDMKQYFEFSIDSENVVGSYVEKYAAFNDGLSTSKEDDTAHTIMTEFRNMVTVAGGKWVTYRARAEEAMDYAVEAGLIYKRPCSTMFMSVGTEQKFDVDALEQGLLNEKDMSAELVEYATFCRDEEYAVCAEDVLSRRLRVGQLNKALAEKLTPVIEKVFQ